MMRKILGIMVALMVLTGSSPGSRPGLLFGQDKPKPAKAAKPAAKSSASVVEPAKPVELSTEFPPDMIKGDVNFTVKLVLPEGTKMGRDIYVRVAGYTVLNSRPKLYEWAQFGKEEISGKLERASVLVFTAGRDAKTEGKDKKTALSAKEFMWRAELPNPKPGQTDIEPVNLNVTLELKELEPIAQGGLTGTDFVWDLKLDGTQFNVNAIWFDKEGKPQTESFPNLKDLQAGLAAKGVASAMIIRANETDNDEEPVRTIKVVSKGQRRAKGLMYLAMWMTEPGDGLLLIKRVSNPTEDFPRMTQAPENANLFRKHMVFRQNDMGDMSSANKANAKGPIFYGKMAGKYFKLQLDELVLSPDPSKEPLKLMARIVVQPDGSKNLVGQ